MQRLTPSTNIDIVTLQLNTIWIRSLKVNIESIASEPRMIIDVINVDPVTRAVLQDSYEQIKRCLADQVEWRPKNAHLPI